MDKDRRLKLSEYPEVMTIKDVCEFLAISRVTAYRFLQENNIKYMFVGLIGFNFIIELLMNVVISPAIIRLLNIRKK